MTQITALFATILIETVVITTWFHKDMREYTRLVAIAAIPTLITHPFLWAATQYFSSIAAGYLTVVILESVVIVIESFLLRFLTRELLSRCLLVSFVANATSAFIGVLWWYALPS